MKICKRFNEFVQAYINNIFHINRQFINIINFRRPILIHFLLIFFSIVLLYVAFGLAINGCATIAAVALAFAYGSSIARKSKKYEMPSHFGDVTQNYTLSSVRSNDDAY